MPLHGENRTYPAYTNLRQIPGGANALIHLAVHAGWGIDCVQKTYDRPGREDSVAFVEPRLLRVLEHGHIVKILDTQPDGDREHAVTMVMPFYAGGSLHDFIDNNPRISVGRVVQWIADAADALSYLHVEHGLIHRDIKPKNFVLDSDGNLFLCDFGSAAAMNTAGVTGPIRATVPYQPPEVAKHGYMSDKSDVYSLGLTALELLGGRFLWHGLDAASMTSRVDTGRRAYPDQVLSSSARPPHVPAALRTLLTGCVNADPDARPTSAELVTALMRLGLIDWTHVAGEGLDGTWTGAWPPRGRASTSKTIRVESEVVSSGQHRGRRKLTASYRTVTSSGWRTIGSELSPTWAGAQDAAAVSRFFKTVADRVAHRFPI